MKTTPKIFISYSWSSQEHEAWVIDLAQRLMADGVDVMIDKWNLKEGHDKYNFMETMVKSPEIDKVLIILDKKYVEKADQRTGGVGTETQIISPKIYGDVSQEKFIPIIAEKDFEGNAYIPTFLAGRIYIDLSSPDNYEQNLESLTRNIYQMPSHKKPKLGKAPPYLFEEELMSNKTSFILRSFDTIITKTPQRINSTIRDFLNEFFEDLKKYRINFLSREAIYFGKEICDNINSYTPLRNDYINFLDKLIRSHCEFDIEIFIKFLEKLPLLKSSFDNTDSGYVNDFDNFKFFIHEIFLYLVAIGIKNEDYKFVEELLYSKYFFQEKYSNNNKPTGFEYLYNGIDTIDHYYSQTFSKKFISPMADLIIKRIPENFSKDDLVNADLLCYYIAVLNDSYWFPITYIYQKGSRFEIFDRLVSKRHFEKVKVLFNVNRPNELKEKVLDIKAKDTYPEKIKYSSALDRVKFIYDIIDIETIATIR